MADKFSKYEVAPDKFSKYEKNEPGWFEPGSKSEAVTRGFSQAATFGFGDEIQAGIRSLLGNESYKTLRDQERGANVASSEANPGSYLAGNVVGSLPQAMNIAGVARNAGKVAGSKVLGSAAGGAGAGGVYGVAQGAGQAKELKDVPLEAVKQGAIGAATGGVQGGFVGRAGSVRPKMEDRGFWMPKTGAEYAKRAADTTKSGAQSLINQLPQTLLGGYTGVNSAMKADWADPYSALADVGKDAALGYGAGYAMGKVPTALEFVKDVGKAMPANTVRVLGSTLVDASETNIGSALPFGALTSYLKQAAGATNPAVQQVAEQAQGIADSNDPDAKRKAAMVLQDTPEGRAVGNSSSRVRDQE